MRSSFLAASVGVATFMWWGDVSPGGAILCDPGESDGGNRVFTPGICDGFCHQGVPSPCWRGGRPWVDDVHGEGVLANWLAIKAAADYVDVDPVLVAAVCARETGCRSMVGGKGKAMSGPMQVYWPSWRNFLRANLPEHMGSICEEDLLNDPAVGIYAGTLVLASTLKTAGGDVHRGLCLYGSGPSARRWTDCLYSRGVVRFYEHARRFLDENALWRAEDAYVALR